MKLWGPSFQTHFTYKPTLYSICFIYFSIIAKPCPIYWLVNILTIKILKSGMTNNVYVGEDVKIRLNLGSTSQEHLPMRGTK